jgi:hypothetical protein
MVEHLIILGKAILVDTGSQAGEITGSTANLLTVDIKP